MSCINKWGWASGLGWATYLSRLLLLRDDFDTTSMQSTTKRLSQEYFSCSSRLLFSRLLAKPTRSLDADCQVSQEAPSDRTPCRDAPCHTIFCDLKAKIFISPETAVKTVRRLMAANSKIAKRLMVAAVLSAGTIPTHHSKSVKTFFPLKL